MLMHEVSGGGMVEETQSIVPLKELEIQTFVKFSPYTVTSVLSMLYTTWPCCYIIFVIFL